MTTLAAASASSSAEPGTLAFLIVFGMAVVLFFLFRSMSKHLRRVNAVDKNGAASSAEADAASMSSGAASSGAASSGDRRRGS
jgi:hypothetical protein